MTAFKSKFIKWFWPLLNSALVSAASAGIVAISAVQLNSSETFNLVAHWNALLTLKLFAIAWAANFLPVLLAYLKQSPLPAPDDE